MSDTLNHTYSLQTAVLFLVFNRPDTTEQVFNAIRQAKPPRLYVAADGPRSDRPNEAEQVEKVRRIATSVDWPCEVKILFQKENLGCKLAVVQAIDWFFTYEQQGIVLEDDCLPHADFFIYCETLLERYSTDERVWAITGDNFQNGRRRGEASYYFSRFNHAWGWASWRRAWSKRDMEMMFWPKWKQSSEWIDWLPDKFERKYWENNFDLVFRNEIDTWDFQWTASVWFNRGLTVTPNVNLIRNIGFGKDATHTLISKSNSDSNFMATEALGPIVYSTNVLSDVEADRYVFNTHFEGFKFRFPFSLYYLPRRLFAQGFRFLKRVLSTPTSARAE